MLRPKIGRYRGDMRLPVGNNILDSSKGMTGHTPKEECSAVQYEYRFKA